MLTIRQTASSRQAQARTRRATAELNRELADGLTAAADTGRASLVMQWRRELTSVQPFTQRGVQSSPARAGRHMQAGISITPRVWRYMHLHILGGTRRFRFGKPVFLPSVSRRERNRRRPGDRFEIPLGGGPNTIILQRRAGRNRVLGFRIFKATYEQRASGAPHLQRVMPALVEQAVIQTLARHRDKAR